MSLLGTRVKLLREAKKWTQEELAAESGVSVTTISRYENERVAMFSGAVLARLAAALGVDAGLLLVTLKEPPLKEPRTPLRAPARAP
jgi:transcriptional regulator with XRE-family HTH domain